MTRIIYESIRSVVVVSQNKIKVIQCAVQGPDAIPPDTYAAHIENTDNPHGVGLFQLLVPEGNAGQWIRIADDGTALIPTPPPLTEMPVLPQPTDEKVKADPADPAAGFLNAKTGGLIYVDEAGHVLRLRGIMSDSYPGNYYYGTNDEGQLGLWPLPGSLIYESGIGAGLGAEDENEWLNAGEVGFYGWP